MTKIIRNTKEIYHRFVAKFIKNEILNSRHLSAFLTLSCNIRCEYCIQGAYQRGGFKAVSGERWINLFREKDFGVRFIKPRLAIIGGEPTLHKDFKQLVEGLCDHYNIIVGSNFNSSFYKDFNGFIQWAKMHPVEWHLTFHPTHMDIDLYLSRMKIMKDAGLKAKGFCVDYNLTNEIKEKLNKLDIYFLTPIGIINGKLFPTESFLKKHGPRETGINNYSFYEAGFSNKQKKRVLCKINRILLDPEGNYYRCHSHLYNRTDSLGNVFEDDLEELLIQSKKYLPCDHFGCCSPCDYSEVNIRICR